MNTDEGGAMYSKEQINECFPHKTDEWSQRTADDLNSVHSHVDALEADGMTAEEAWGETLRLMREQRLAARQ
jgi:hypothetical protein